MAVLKRYTGSVWETVGAPSGSSGRSPDDFPTSPNADDQEFEATSSALPSGWSWFNQGTSTYDEQQGVGVLVAQTGAGVNRGIVRAIPAAGIWTAKAKVSASGGSAGANGYELVGICLRSSADSKMSVFGWTETGQLAAFKYTGDAYSADILTAITVAGGAFNQGYLRLVRNSSTSYDFAYSRDGRAWSVVLAAYNPTAFHTPDQIGFFLRHGATQLAAHWYRVT